MRLDDLGERVRRILAASRDGAGLPDWTTETPLYGAGVGLHSLEVVALLVRLEEEFGISLEDDELDRSRLTVGGLVRLVRRKVEGRAPEGRPGPAR